MNKQDAEKVITEYVRPIFGFALKRCKSEQDAEDLAQEIVLKVFRALLVKDDIVDMGKFVWTVAHNTLSNYYRDVSRGGIGVPLEDVEEVLADQQSLGEDNEEEIIRQLKSEIAYLSKLQRRIVIAYYFENRKQADIAKELGIPVGTVKWHLFEAKKELKRGMDMVRKSSDLKFNPVKFDSWGLNGSLGTKNPEEFMRSVLLQNICYCVRQEAKTINEIAQDLGVSPVFVEGEAEFLEEYGILQQQRDKYIVNFLLTEPTSKLLDLNQKMYKKAAELYANDLYDELKNSGILEDVDIISPKNGNGEVVFEAGDSKTTEAGATEAGATDENFLLWALVPYITAWSGENLREQKITFDEVATLRPDGAKNIYHAEVFLEDLRIPEGFITPENWCGPMWNGTEKQMLWQVDSPWSDRENTRERNVPEEGIRVIHCYNAKQEGTISMSDYAWLAERGYMKTNGKSGEEFQTSWQIVILKNPEIKSRLLEIGEKIKLKYRQEFEALKAPFVEESLRLVPPHLRKVKEYELQFLFHSDGIFICHCIYELLNNGKLKEPTAEQRKALTTVLAPC